MDILDGEFGANVLKPLLMPSYARVKSSCGPMNILRGDLSKTADKTIKSSWVRYLISVFSIEMKNFAAVFI